MDQQQTQSISVPHFTLPVDSNNKSTVFNPFSATPPHMLAFHLAWISLFSCFFSTFSIPPLIPIIRDDLNLTQDDINRAGIASFLGSIFSRLAMGPACDIFGPRIASATLSLLTAPIILSTSIVSTPQSFILVRFLVGISLANFVANQFWMSSMFSGSVVGLANGVSAGWANMGSGIAQLVMPIICSFLNNYLDLPLFTSWRVSFLIPATLQVVTAIMILVYGQDLPIGNYTESKRMEKDLLESQGSFIQVVWNGLRDYRGWILGLAYGFSFGAELTTDNVIAGYFYDTFGVNLQVAGSIAAGFAMTNFFSRPMGGVLSDEMGRKFGIRGRLWGLWVVQTSAGLLCIMLGRAETLWGSVVVMSGFSVLVQAASGLVFGVVPFVSKRSLGVISGMTGSGGTVGAVTSQLLLFSGCRFSTETSISLMGVMIVVCTLPVTLIYFPQWGGMLSGPSSSHTCEDPTETDHQDYYPLLHT